MVTKTVNGGEQIIPYFLVTDIWVLRRVCQEEEEDRELQGLHLKLNSCVFHPVILGKKNLDSVKFLF
jgi:hypothetical protein